MSVPFEPVPFISKYDRHQIILPHNDQQVKTFSQARHKGRRHLLR